MSLPEKGFAMAAYRPESTVMVRPFVRSHEGNEVVIGDPQRGVFLAIPPEAVEILDSLSAGETVGEAARQYEVRHGEKPDIDDFLDVMIAEGFVRRGDEPGQPDGHGHHHGRRTRTVSLNWVSPQLSRRVTSAPALIAYFTVIAAAFALFLKDPGTLPGTSVLLFPHGSFAVLATITVVVCLAGSFVHELAHAVVARAEKVPVTLGIGNLMYTMVAQTTISGMRTASKAKQYLAFLSGTIADLVTAALLFFVLYANRHGVITLAPAMQDLVGAVTLGYLFRVNSQFLLYIRTDFYYALAAAFNCRSLMSDTERLLKNGLLRLFGRKPERFDLSRLNRRERRAIRGYSVFYVIGRTYAILMLLFVFLPIQWRITVEFVTYTKGKHTHLTLFDFLLITVLSFVFYGGGLVMWVRGIYRSLTQRRRTPAEPEYPQPAMATP
jgi:putative peptide zinc metalloprotease protein